MERKKLQIFVSLINLGFKTDNYNQMLSCFKKFVSFKQEPGANEHFYYLRDMEEIL